MWVRKNHSVSNVNDAGEPDPDPKQVPCAVASIDERLPRHRKTPLENHFASARHLSLGSVRSQDLSIEVRHHDWVLYVPRSIPITQPKLTCSLRATRFGPIVFPETRFSVNKPFRISVPITPVMAALLRPDRSESSTREMAGAAWNIRRTLNSVCEDFLPCRPWFVIIASETATSSL
jgi:hypothetical protein